MAVTLTDKYARTNLVAVGNNQVWWESSVGTMVVLSAANDDIDTTKQLVMSDAYGKVFIANETKLRVADFINAKVVTTDIGTYYPDKTNVLTGGTSSAQIIVDYITALTTACTLYGMPMNTEVFVSAETVTGTSDDGNAVSFTVSSFTTSPHWYNWTRYGNSATYGTMPSTASLVCLYRGRIVLAGDKYYPHQWYMSRQADPWDWNYTANDAESPVAGHNADAGEIGDIITALIPRKDDYLLFGCANSIWIMRGDPCTGGSLDEVSLTTGIFGAYSWCWDDSDNLYFWGSNGIYKLSTQTGEMTNLTIKCIPDIVADTTIDPSTHRITFGYDRRRHGILVCITTVATGANKNYWLDLRTGGFFPETYQNACGVYSQLFCDVTDDDNRVLVVGCKDGYIRKFLDTAKDDDVGSTDAAISSYATLGPAALSSTPDNKGRIISTTVVAAGGATSGVMSDSDGFQLGFYVADDAETCQENIEDGATAFLTVAVTGTGRKSRINTKIRGAYEAIKVSSIASSQTWAFDKITQEFVLAGRIR